jgi:glycosyltransferase involved in cell wall biosynthesis
MSRIIFVSSMGSSSWGGSEELWSQSALRLGLAGHEIGASVAYWPQPSQNVIELTKQGVDVSMRRLPARRLPARIWRRIARKETAHYDWLRAQRPDLVVVSQGGNTDGFGWLQFCKENALPFVTVMQCNAEAWWPNDDFGAGLASALRGARRVFCVSKHNLDLLESQIGEALPNARVIWNPYKLPSGAIPNWPRADGMWRVACVARLEPSAKGQDLLLGALALPQWRDRPLEVNLYGAGFCERNLRKTVARLALKNIHFRGHVDDVKSIWEHNHMLVLPSRFEGLPLALVEGMWAARPAVVTDIGGNAELCLDEETGFVAAAPALTLVNDALERAWKRRDDWQTLGMAARKRVDELVPKDPVGDFCRLLLDCIDPIRLASHEPGNACR